MPKARYVPRHQDFELQDPSVPGTIHLSYSIMVQENGRSIWDWNAQGYCVVQPHTDRLQTTDGRFVSDAQVPFSLTVIWGGDQQSPGKRQSLSGTRGHRRSTGRCRETWNLHRRLWITSMAAGGLALSRARLTQAEPCGQSSTDVSALLRLRVRPGYLYELRPVQPDSVRVGTRWRGDILPVADPQKAGQAPGPISPLEPMFRKRFIIKVDDVATWSLDDFQRFARFIEANDAKADLGIIPGRCGPEAFSWVRNLDPERFDIWNHTWSHGDGGVPNHYRQPYDVQCRNLEMAHRKVLEETGITMRGFCGGGIKYQGQPVHDQDDATHWIVRNHADYRVHFHADAAFADRGYGQINSDGIFMPWRFSWFENEPKLSPGCKRFAV